MNTANELTITASLVRTWFDYACVHLQGIVQGCVFFGEANTGPYKCIMVSSEGYQVTDLVQENINAAIKRRKSIVTRTGSSELEKFQAKTAAVNAARSLRTIDSKNYLVTCPILINRKVYGALSIEFKHNPGVKNQDYLAQVESTVKWLAYLAKTETVSGDVDNRRFPRADLALQIVALSLNYDTSTEAAVAVVTELASNLNCERVSLCFVESHSVRLDALSHNARFEAKQNLIRSIEHAVEEAVIQKETLVYPVVGTECYMLQAHDELAKKYSCRYICTIPLIYDEQVTGGIIFERTTSEFDESTVELCEQLASLLAPVFEYRRRNDLPFTVKAKAALNSVATGMLGNGYSGFKFAAIITVTIFLLLNFMQWEYRISSSAVLEGTVERVITAPEDGYIKEAVVRPGDVVDASQVLARLDDRDLQLEKLKWSGKQKQVSKEYREALASRNKSQIGILRARSNQAETQIEILDKKLERTVITAPIDGVIVSGDFTQALGSPVERGQILYTISPLDSYRVLLDVDESDIPEIKPGMKGELVLTAEAVKTYNIVIDKITPVSVSGDGRNYFKVEASLEHTPDFLRPGMQGVSKIAVGDRQLLWIWTHKMLDWLRLKIWSWW